MQLEIYCFNSKIFLKFGSIELLNGCGMVEDEGLAYWMRWQVAVCAMMVALPTVIAVTVILKIEKQPLRAACLWAPCWSKVSPFWLLAYRSVAFLFMAWLLGQLVLLRGAFNFFFYTQLALWHLLMVAGFILNKLFLKMRKPVASLEETLNNAMMQL